MRNFVLIGIILSLLVACSKNDEQSQAEKDDQIINDYLNNNGLSATHHESGLYYIITQEGSGAHPTINSTVTVKYKGYLTNDIVFDETEPNSSATFPLSGLIEGWQICIPLLKMGGSGTFFIPSGLGYGSQPKENIPANSVLIFEIQLIDFY